MLVNYLELENETYKKVNTNKKVFYCKFIDMLMVNFKIDVLYLNRESIRTIYESDWI